MSDSPFDIRDGESGEQYLQRILYYWADVLAADTHTDLANRIMKVREELSDINAEHERRYEQEFPAKQMPEKLTHKGGKGYYNDEG